MLQASDMLADLPRLLAEASGLPVNASGHMSAVDPVLHLAGRRLVVKALANARSAAVSHAARALAARARDDGPDAVPLLVVPFMGDAGRRACREAGVAFIDLCGNADIVAPPLVVRVEGRPNRFRQRGRPSSVFAPRSSRITRLLLLDPSRWWSQQELAREAAMGPGYVSRVCRRLHEEGLIEREGRGLRPSDPGRLLRAWQSEYRFERHEVRRGHVSARSGEELAERVSDVLRAHDVDHAFTGLTAAWKLAPFALHRLVSLFVAEPVPTLALDALGWREESRGSNLWIARPNDEGVFHGRAEIDGMSCTSAVQAWLDLHGMPERSDEAAAHLRGELLPWA